MKILIADDEPHIRRGLERLDWQSVGLKVCAVAKNGKEALDMARKEKPDIILSDIKMPGLDGLEMTEEFLKANPGCAVIFLSGYREFSYVKRALSMGAFEYLLKPTEPEEILECCGRVVREIKDRSQKDIAMAEMKYRIKELEVNEVKVERPEIEGSRGTVQEILGFLDENYGHELSLQMLAERFHFNAIYINRIIKKETGYTFLEILNNKRMHRAAQVLKNPDIKIGRVADLCGIPDQRYFSQIFKKYYGQSPRQYRKMALKEQGDI